MADVSATGRRSVNSGFSYWNSISIAGWNAASSMHIIVAATSANQAVVNWTATAGWTQVSQAGTNLRQCVVFARWGNTSTANVTISCDTGNSNMAAVYWTVGNCSELVGDIIPYTYDGDLNQAIATIDAAKGGLCLPSGHARSASSDPTSITDATLYTRIKVPNFTGAQGLACCYYKRAFPVAEVWDAVQTSAAQEGTSAITLYFPPLTPPGPSFTRDGVAGASIGSVDGVAAASIGEVDGVTAMSDGGILISSDPRYMRKAA